MIYIVKDSDNVFWSDTDAHTIKLTAADVDDEELVEIVFAVADGRGDGDLVDAKTLRRIFDEAYARHILRYDILLSLHAWAEYNWHISETKPRYKVGKDGRYILG